MSESFKVQQNINASVILLHGLARSEISLRKLEAILQQQGYHTVNYNYPSTKFSVEKLAEDAISQALSQCPKDNTIHFVTHSMGGILVRQFLSQHNIENLGRVVMLGPPNQGSQVVDFLKDISMFKLINGPASVQLDTTEIGLPKRLGAVNFEVGIIAGTRSVNPFLSTMLPKPDDGKVSVENTKIDGMSDHIALPVTHPFMMRNDKVIEQVLYFLRQGKFEREETI